MPIAEDKAIAILEELIRKPETKAEDIPRIWQDIINVYNAQFAPVEEPKKKKRRRSPNSPNIGWPAGVSREEYKHWKEAQQNADITENLNPQEYKRQRDAGLLQPAAKAEAKPKAAKPAAKKTK